MCKSQNTQSFKLRFCARLIDAAPDLELALV